MKTQRIYLRIMHGLLVVTLACAGAWPQSAQSAYSTDWYSIDAGGGTSASATYQLTTAMGQPDAGLSAGETYILGGGFLGAMPESLTDISLEKTVNNANPLEGATIVYTIRCWNNGPSDSSGFEITDQLPAGVTYQSHSTVGTYTPATGVWEVGPVTASGLGILTITASVNGGTTGQTIVNTATVTASDQNDPDPNNDTNNASVTVGFGVHYVATNGLHVSPFVNWAEAATNIQDAVDVAVEDGVVIVSNGVYAAGGKSSSEYKLTNRVYITKEILVQSVNGPSETHIKGRADPVSTNGPAAQRCAYLGSGAQLEGFTLRDGHTYADPDDPESEIWDPNGGGLYFYGGGSVSNCVVRDCSSYENGGGVYIKSAGSMQDCLVSNNWTEGYGGGIYMDFGGWISRCRILDNTAAGGGGGVMIDDDGDLSNCLLTGNESGGNAGGVYLSWGGDLNFCTVAGNHAADSGGGVRVGGDGDLWGTILYGNTAGTDGANWFDGTGGGTFRYVCTTPDPGGTSNVIANPQFINASIGDYRLLATSPGIDAGEPDGGWGTDLAGLPRELDGDNNGSIIVDLGAFEYPDGADLDGDGMADGYEAEHGFDLTDPLDATGNSDGDPHDNLEEYIAGSIPTDSNSYFRITNAWPAASGHVVQWAPSVSNRWYSVLWTNDLTGGFTSLVENIEWPQNSATDTTHITQSEGFYRVEVELK